MNETQAKRFFADRVIQQAKSEGTPLSDAERQMLYWSKSDPKFTADSQFIAALATQMSDEEYEAKVCGLLRRRFQADLAANPRARDQWRRALASFSHGDHWISIPIHRAVGSKLRSWSQIWGVRAVPAALATLAVGGGVLFAVRAFFGHDLGQDQSGVAVWELETTVAILYVLLRLAFGRVVDDLVGRVLDRLFGNHVP